MGRAHNCRTTKIVQTRDDKVVWGDTNNALVSGYVGWAFKPVYGVQLVLFGYNRRYRHRSIYTPSNNIPSYNEAEWLSRLFLDGKTTRNRRQTVDYNRHHQQ